MICKNNGCEGLKVSATNFGFEASWISDILEKFGGDVLALAIEAARNGLSIGFIVEVIEKFGPQLLDLMISWLNKWKMMKFQMAATAEGEVVDGPIEQGFDAAFVDLIIEKYLPTIIEKYLPSILEKYGPQIIQFIIQMFMNNIKK